MISPRWPAQEQLRSARDVQPREGLPEGLHVCEEVRALRHAGDGPEARHPCSMRRIGSVAAGEVRSHASIDGIASRGRSSPAMRRRWRRVWRKRRHSRQRGQPGRRRHRVGPGNLPERVDCVLSTERLGPSSTTSRRTSSLGRRWGPVWRRQAVLAEHGSVCRSILPAARTRRSAGSSPPSLAGPLRYSAGTLRDLLIGISVAHPSGTVSKAGGMVVKNVSGYDLTRLYLGSLGTLGVIVSANFKVLPLPVPKRRSLAAYDEPCRLFPMRERCAGCGNHRRARGRPGVDGAWGLAIRVEGRDETGRGRRTNRHDPVETSPPRGAESRRLVDFLRREAAGRPTRMSPGPLRRTPRDGSSRHRSRRRMRSDCNAVPCRASPGLGTVVAVRAGGDGSPACWPTCKASCSVLPKP